MKEKVIIITGATSMIGRAAAHLFSHHNTHLILIGRSLAKLENLANTLNTDITTYALDICNTDAVTQTINEIENRFQRIDCIVQNTAIDSQKKNLEY